MKVEIKKERFMSGDWWSASTRIGTKDASFYVTSGYRRNRSVAVQRLYRALRDISVDVAQASQKLRFEGAKA